VYPCVSLDLNEITRLSLQDRITSTLSPELGPYTADVVARHLCAKFSVADEEKDPARLAELREFLRRGLVAYVGAERAEQLAVTATAAAS
jgi:hypothetical protein